MKIKFWLPILLLFFTYFRASATHIVGGEFEMVHESGSNYKLTLNLYFDNITGSPGAVDPSVTVSIFQKGTNRFMSDHTLPLRVTTQVPYTNIDCTIGSLSTSKLVYDNIISLPSNRYNSPDGYYAVWERCCRNISINNIRLPGEAGQAFYMEFPPTSIINSSPKLFPPLSDYACVNQLFYFDFAGSDPDGDSLIYEVVTPLNGYSNSLNPLPFPSPAPYPEVNWMPGYNQSNQIQGNPPLQIDRHSGFLRVQPSRIGLFVFGIRCSEYRNGVKIGEIRREFQMLVVNCPTNERPKVEVRETGKTLNYTEGDTIRISGSTNRCLNLRLSDTDPSENLTAFIRPVNFTTPLPNLSNANGTVNVGGVKDTLLAQLCFPDCFSTQGGAYLLDVIVQDDGCSLPKMDTVRLTLVVEPISSQAPVITVPANAYSGTVGDVISFAVTGTDADNDPISISAQGRNFNLASQAIQFTPASGTGTATASFRWALDCQAMQQASYLIDFTVTALACGVPTSRTTTVEVTTNYANTVPELQLNTPDSVLYLKLGEPFTATITGTDADNNPLNLSAAGEGFLLANAGMQFSNNPAGAGRAEGILTWTPTCASLSQDTYRVKFMLQENTCNPFPPVEKVLELRLVQPGNAAPAVTLNYNGTPGPDSVLTVPFDTLFTATLTATDPDGNPLLLSAAGNGFQLADYGMTFSTNSSPGSASGVFSWKPDCRGINTQNLEVVFTVGEEACQAAAPQLKKLRLRVQPPVLKPFLPANIFTPNNDGYNDFFELPSLPPNFCSSVFSSIRVYNRWGAEVYKSTEPNFKWDGKNMSDGIYYYTIEYSDRSYKGFVEIVR